MPKPTISPDRLEELTFLDGPAAKLRDLVHKVPGPVKDALHGVWLGHPLHPMLAQATMGAWVSASVLDLTGDQDVAARRLIVSGLACVAPTAWSGWVDWADLHPQQQRVGLVHAASNAVAIGLYTASLISRARGQRISGRVLSLAGLGVVSLGGYLGGHLAFRQAAGANHTEEVRHLVPAGWQEIGPLADIPDNKGVRRMIGEVPVLVHRSGSEVNVLADHCSHLSAPLSDGDVEDGCVTCPWHGSVFRLSDGTVVHGPATAPAPSFQTRVRGGILEVCLPGAG